MAKRPKRTRTTNLPADVIDTIVAKYGESGTLYDNVVSFFSKILNAWDYDDKRGKVISYKYRSMLLRTSSNLFTDLVDLGLLERTKRPSKARHTAAHYRIVSKDLTNLVRIKYEEIYGVLDEDKNVRSQHVGKTLNAIGFDPDAVTFPGGQIKKSDKFLAAQLDFLQNKIDSRITIDTESGNYVYQTKEYRVEYIEADDLESFKADKLANILDRDDKTMVKLQSTNHLNDYYPRVNTTNQRMEHILNGLSEFYHDYLLYKDTKKKTTEPMVLLDLACSQPTILNSLMTMDADSKINIKLLSTKDFNYYSIYAAYIKNRKDIHIGMLSSHTYNSKTIANTDLSALVTDSTLYPFICNHLGIEYNDQNKVIAKQFFFSCIYGSLPFKDTEKDEKREFMEQFFLDVVNFIDTYKMGMVDYFTKMKKNKRKQYDKIATTYKTGERVVRQPRKMAAVSFSILMQRIESYIFIFKSLKELQERNIPAVPKHDGIIVPISEVDRARAVIEKYCSLYLGEGQYNLVAKTQV